MGLDTRSDEARLGGERQPPRPLRAVVVGTLTRDRNEVGGRVFHRIGGAVWHAGTVLADLGVRTVVVTRIAAEDEDLVAALRAAGVEVRWQPSARTTTFVNRYPAENWDLRTQLVPAVADPIQASALAQALEGADLAFLGPLHPDDLAEDIVTAFGGRRPSVVAIDVQGYTRTIRDSVVAPGLDRRLADMSAACDVIKAGRDEASLITGAPGAERATEALAAAHAGREIVVTCGAGGAFVAYAGRLHYEPAVPAEIVDPTGAGDIFLAAYVAKRLEGRGVAAAASFAADFTARRLAGAGESPSPDR